MGKLLRYTAVAIVLIAGYFAMSYMQARFDRADLKKALAAVQSVHPPDDTANTVVDAIQVKYGIPPEQIRWDAQIQSKWWGTVRVTAHIPQNDVILSWLVDVSAQQITPESEAARQLFR